MCAILFFFVSCEIFIVRFSQQAYSANEHKYLVDEKQRSQRIAWSFCSEHAAYHTEGI